ncbi:MAG TPA: hypothetical protein VFQ72_01985 [Candidatus Paceibacterota bacterium]|nr:hypothetical protein [Candidatus Paceibacterota bacterium]
MRALLGFFGTKIGIAVLAAIVIVGAAAGFKYSRSAQEKQKGAATLVVEQIIKDSLKNLNEIEGDSAFVASTTGPDDAAPQEPAVPYTATDRFSQQIFREYISAKQNGKEVDADTSARIAESVLAQDYSDRTPAYSVLDLHISADESASSLRTYGNSLGAILSAPPAAKENELEIFLKLSSKSTDDYGKELAAIQKRYISMRTALLALPAPKSFAAAQVDILNSLNLFVDAIDGALNIDADPIGALNKIARHDDGMTALQKALASIKKTFAAKGMTFAAKEKGFILTE